MRDERQTILHDDSTLVQTIKQLSLQLTVVRAEKGVDLELRVVQVELNVIETLVQRLWHLVQSVADVLVGDEGTDHEEGDEE